MPVIDHDIPTRAKAPVPPRAVMSLDDFRKAAREGTVPRDAIVRSPAESVVEPAGARRMRFTLSTGAVDRDRDVLAPSGWILDNYRRARAPVMWAHDYKQPPIGRATDIRVLGGKLVAEAEFTPPDLNPFGDTIYRMLKAGYLGGVSVGFRPVEWTYNPTRQGTDFHKQELLEFSVVPIPSNPEAIVEARAAGIDVAPLKAWASRVLTEADDEGDDEFIDIEGVRITVSEFITGLSAAMRDVVPQTIRRTLGLIAEPKRPARSAEEAFDEWLESDPDEVRRAIREYAAGEIRKALRKLRGEV